MIHNNFFRITLGTAFILMIPLVAMQFSTGVDWDLTDFTIIGVLLLSIGFSYELISKKLTNPAHRAIVAIVLAFALLVIWADLAVGIFNIPGISGS